VFAESINEALRTCDAFITLIGRHWLEADSAGHRRIDDSEDWVRTEIAVALSREIRVIPVLVDGAALPQKADLPAELVGLAEHQALIMDNSTWQLGIDRLVLGINASRPAGYPSLALSTTAVEFGRLGLNAPSPRRSVRLINTGSGQLNAEASSDVAWLTVSMGADTVNLLIDTSQPGEHLGHVLVRSAGGSATIDVSATVSADLGPHPSPPPLVTPSGHVNQRAQMAAKWLVTGLLVLAVMTQLAWSSEVRAAVVASRPNLPADGPWPTLLWLLPTPLLAVAAYLVATGRRPGVALGCIGSAVLWVVTSLVLIVSKPGSFDVSSHVLTLLLLIAATSGLVVVEPVTREPVRPNRLERIVPASALLAVAVILRSESDQIARAAVGADMGSIEWLPSLRAPMIWLHIVVPLLICIPAALFVCNTVQVQVLSCLAWLDVVYALVARALIFRGVAAHSGSATAVVVSDVVYLAGGLCLVLAVRVGQRRSAHP
jgi:hypothetical protein